MIKLLGTLKYQFFCSLCRKSGWESISGESHLNALLRGRVFLALATFGHDKTHKEAIRRFQTLLNDRNTPLLSADTRKVLSLHVFLNHWLIYRGLFKVDMQMCYMLCRLLMLLSFWTLTPQTGTGLIPYWIFIEKLIQYKRRNWFYVRFNNIWA